MAFDQQQEITPAQQMRVAGLEAAMQYHEWILAMDDDDGVDTKDKVPNLNVVLQTATQFESYIKNGT